MRWNILLLFYFYASFPAKEAQAMLESEKDRSNERGRGGRV